MWCSGTAILLVRIYKAAGFNAWIYDFGRPDILIHATTLVEVEDEVYLQDAYLNYEYVDETGRPVPFLGLLSNIKSRKPARVNASIAAKIAFFVNETNAQRWTGQYFDSIKCNDLQTGMKCDGAVVTLPQFLEIYYLMESTYDFLVQTAGPARSII